jgi:hypothetical protein
MNIQELQQQMSILQSQLDPLTKQPYAWDNAPVICKLNDVKWLLGPEAPEKMNWYEAIEWCRSVGGELPTREILLICYLNTEIRRKFKTEWHWSSTECSATLAWGQGFSYGYQGNGTKTGSDYVRAARAIKLGA